MGGNGSGKSTLIKCLSGYQPPDSGSRIVLRGSVMHSMRGAKGMAFVHQDLGLVPTMSVMENLALGHGYTLKATGRIDWKAEEEQARTILESHGLAVSPRDKVGALSQSMRASIAILRALRDPEGISVLVLDEPTAALPEKERGRLMELVRSVSKAGTGILYVSHRIPEVTDLCDEATVLQDGVVVARLKGEQLTDGALIDAMTRHRPRIIASRGAFERDGAPVLKLTGIAGGRVKGVDLTAYRGEIVGITGLMGAGQTELLRLIFGVRNASGGEMELDGKKLRLGYPRGTLDAGFAYVPADRRGESIFPLQTVRENMSLPSINVFTHLGRISKKTEVSTVDTWLERYDVKPRDAESRMASLSGGNQQKAVVGRWLERNPRVLLLDEPTQGVDVHARSQILEQIRAAADNGMVVLFADSDVEMVCEFSDRVVVMSDGRIAGEVVGPHIDRTTVMELTQGLEVLS